MNSFSLNSSLKCIQLNFHKAKDATQQLILYMEANEVDITFIQEPHFFRKTLPGYPRNYRLYFDEEADPVKAAIVIRNPNITSFLNLNLSDYCFSVVDITVASSSFTICSAYFEPSVNIEPKLNRLTQILNVKNPIRTMFAMDSNSKSEVWHSPITDGRESKLI